MTSANIYSILAEGLNLGEKPEIGPGEINTQFLASAFRLKITSTRVLVESRTMGTAFTLGDSARARLGTDTLGAGTQGAYSTVETISTIQELTESGKALVTELLNKQGSGNSVTGYPYYITIGSDSTAFDTGQIRLLNELGISQAISSNIATSKLATFTAEIASTSQNITNSKSVNEIGIVTGGKNRFTLDTSKGGQQKNITMNSETSS